MYVHRESARCTWLLRMTVCVESRDFAHTHAISAQVATNIFHGGLKKFDKEPAYALRYAKFLAHTNQDSRTFDFVPPAQLLGCGSLTQQSPSRAAPLWCCDRPTHTF